MHGQKNIKKKKFVRFNTHQLGLRVENLFTISEIFSRYDVTSHKKFLLLNYTGSCKTWRGV